MSRSNSGYNDSSRNPSSDKRSLRQRMSRDLQLRGMAKRTQDGYLREVRKLEEGLNPMIYHPHVHFVVPGGGVSQDGSQWQAGPENFLLPEKAASIVYRAKFRDCLSYGKSSQYRVTRMPEKAGMFRSVGEQVRPRHIRRGESIVPGH